MTEKLSLTKVAILALFSVVCLYPLTTIADENLKEIAIKYKDATSFYLLAQKYAVSGSTNEDFREAIKWYQEAAKLGHTKSQLKLGTLYFEGLGTDINYDIAAKWLIEPANSGYVAAQYMMGIIYLDGTKKLIKNERRAFEWFSKAAEGFHADALFQVGKMHYHGIGTNKDLEKAKKFLELAKEQNIAAADELLAGIDQEKTQSSPPSSPVQIASVQKKSAGEIMLDAAQKGNANAQYQVATAYLNGKMGLQKNQESALIWLERAAKNNHKDAQYLLGSLYYNGNPVKRNLETAKFWLNKSAKSGVENAKVLISAINDQSKSKSQNSGKNISTTDLFLASANKGDREAQFKVGLMYLKGNDGFPKDQEKALHWLNKAATQDHTNAQFEVGMMYYKPGKEINETARSLLLKAADKGHVNAQYFLATIYNQDQRYDDAAKWLDKAFQNNHDEALELLVELYTSGKLGNPDRNRVLKWLEKASLKGLRDAQYKLGEEYLVHEEIANNKSKAFAWIEKSARNGYTQAKYRLATLYQQGIGARKQYTKSARWFREAAQEGHVDAQYDLAELYLQGLGLPRNKSKAKKWLEEAANQGHMKAKIKLGNISRF
ncbi:SEL1-like repeat protein [Kaarinaea lacus]